MQHWNSYWSNTKTLNSFAEGQQQHGYSGDIAQFWQAILQPVAENSTIVDIATGNGGLAVLAQQHNASFNIIATDAADINPLTLFSPSDDCYPALQQIQFMANVPTEQLTLASNSVDLVISQFGFEYAPLAAALAQIHRVLGKKGKFIALVHSQHSFITQDCQDGATVLQQLLQTDGLLSQLMQFANLCQALATETQLSTAQQQQFSEHNTALLQFFRQTQQQFTVQNQQEWFNLIAKDLVPLIMNWQSLTSATVDKTKQNLQHFLQRIQDQIASAWTNQRAEEVKALCQTTWQQVSVEQMQIEEGVLCWIVQLQK
ncbi:class I SAM-dependent methyltransferase [Rheinheimera salexigens]|uniref:Methyltransferase type 11 domain-containing protein n=1 Tax=Rheinheimera salexigens TaxID=1628148 RepID=A0A1E7Q8T4_9GAMM|nr:class I SAM-dependent methyltransferase [Rheinheimera salexigens]OEY70546.1 hypothetical protein BI198_13970 [Rheinheimera salexigens]